MTDFSEKNMKCIHVPVGHAEKFFFGKLFFWPHQISDIGCVEHWGNTAVPVTLDGSARSCKLVMLESGLASVSTSARPVGRWRKDLAF